jgi:hypothetical protein
MLAATPRKALRGASASPCFPVKFPGVTGDSGVASILPFIRPDDGSFDDEITRNMGEAFNGAVKLLRSTAQPAVVYASIAARIIEAAARGECDPMGLQ